MGGYTFDTGVISLYLAGDSRVRPNFEEVASRRGTGFVSSVNMAELFYLNCRRVGREAAILWNRQVGEVLDVVETDERLTLSAGMLKCRTHLLSLPDCYALAVASRTKTTLLTTDSKLAKSEVVQTRHFKV